LRRCSSSTPRWPRRRSSAAPTRRPARCRSRSSRLAGEATPEEIVAFVAERVAPYKKPRAIEIVDEIPKSPSGKILRRMLRDRLARLTEIQRDA
jgi:acyl-coenzyme A synthetase/AMP-(fatty) acid ligase